MNQTTDDTVEILSNNENNNNSNNLLTITSLSDTFAEFLQSHDNDTESLSTHVQSIARTVYAEFETILKAHGPAVIKRLVPIIVTVLEKLDDLFKDQLAYHAEVNQLREDKSMLLVELDREKYLRKESETRLMSIEDQFEDERKSLNEALVHSEAIIRQFEIKSKHTTEQISRFEKKEIETRNENSQLRDRIVELLRSNAELSDNFKSSVSSPNAPIPRSALIQQKPVGNAFDTTSGGLGFDELTNLESDIIADDEDFGDESSCAGPPSDSETGEFASMQKAVGNLIQENVELRETKNALNIVKDDLLNQRDALKIEYDLLYHEFNKQTDKLNELQNSFASTQQELTIARNKLRTLSAAQRDRKNKAAMPSQTNQFTKSEVAQLIQDRNNFKERLLELQEAVKLTETLRVSQRGHSQLLAELPSVTDVHRPGEEDNHTPLHRLLNLISMPRLDFGLDALNLYDTESSELQKTSPSAWIRIRQTMQTSLLFGWVRGYGRVDVADPLLSETSHLLRAQMHTFKPRACPIPKRSRGIDGSNCIQIELTTALSVTSPDPSEQTQQLWLIGRAPPSQTLKTSPNKRMCGKVYIFNPLVLATPLCTLDLVDTFSPLCAADFSIGSCQSPKLADTATFDAIKNFVSFDSDSKLPIRMSRVLIASSDGRFIICGASKSTGSSITFQLHQLASFQLSKIGESATVIVSLENQIAVGVVNSSGGNQLLTFKWNLPADFVSQKLSDNQLNAGLNTNALAIPGATGAPSGPIIMSSVFCASLLWLGSVGGGAILCYDFALNKFVAQLSLPDDTPCLHAIAVGPAAATEPYSRPRLIWLAVSGSAGASSNQALVATRSRLLSVCAEKCVFVHNLDLTAVLVSMIDVTNVIDPVDLTMCRLWVQEDECIWFATRSGLIGRFFHSFLFSKDRDNLTSEILRQDCISISRHAYKRPVQAILTMGYHTESNANTPVISTSLCATNLKSLLVVAIGHDYVFLPTSTHLTRLGDNAIDDGRFQAGTSGAHAIVWSISC